MTTIIAQELERIIAKGGFHSKVASTVLASGKISYKQAEILNQVSEVEIEMTIDIEILRHDHAYEAKQEFAKKNYLNGLR